MEQKGEPFLFKETQMDNFWYPFLLRIGQITSNVQHNTFLSNCNCLKDNIDLDKGERGWRKSVPN